MFFEPLLVAEFAEHLRVGDEAAAFWTAYRISENEEMVKNATFDDSEYNDLELADVLTAQLAYIQVAPMAEAYSVVIPRIMGLILMYLQDYAIANEADDGETSSEPEQQSSEENAPGT